mmetsp:Transcript_19356/g.58498  ORF Transcript_19356/g.58498 Transcript_19356/m.58498 type:complete len:361 (-) Transcript_19356:1452-2534(-)
MVDATRAMLDELMGKERNVPLTERSNKQLHYYDDEICKFTLCGLCPYTLFSNTKSFLGECKYEMHDQLGMDEIQAEYDALSEREKQECGYERKLLELLETLVRDMDRKIERQKERAEKESQPRLLTAADKAKLEELLTQQREMVKESEARAEDGDVDASMAAAAKAEKLKEEHDQNLVTMTAPERIMTVCEVCGVFINCTDAEQRQLAAAQALGKTALGNVTPVSKALGDHLEGKQYTGWLAIRQKCKELREKHKNLPPEDRPRTSRGEREPDRARSSDRGRDRDRERDREVDDRHSHHHSSSRDRDDRRGRDDRYRDDREDRHREDRHRSDRGHRDSRGYGSRDERERYDRRRRERDYY